MHFHSTPARVGQYATAAVFTALALLIILQDAIGPDILTRWRLEHTVAVMLVVATTLAVEAAVSTWTDRRLALSVGFGTVATVGLLLIVLMSGGRQAGAQAERDLVASTHNTRIADAKKRLEDAEIAKKAADNAVVDKAAERNCVAHCKDLLLSNQAKAADEVAAARDAFAAMSPLMAVGSTEGAFWSDTLSPWLPAPTVERVAPVAKYLLLVVFAEFGAACAWLLARRRRIDEPTPANTSLAAEPEAAEPNTVAEPVEVKTELPPPDAPKPDPKPKPKPSPIRKAASPKTAKARKSKRKSHSEIIRDLLERSASGKGFENDAEAARAYGYSPSRFSELQKQWREDGALV